MVKITKTASLSLGQEASAAGQGLAPEGRGREAAGSGGLPIAVQALAAAWRGERIKYRALFNGAYKNLYRVGLGLT